MPKSRRRRAAEPSFDVPNICAACVRILRARSPGERLHGNLAEVIECGKTTCKICLFACTAFGDEFTRTLLLGDFGDVLQITLGVASCELDSRGLIEWGDLRFGLRDTRESSTINGVRSFVVLGNSARALDRAIWSSAEPVRFDARIPTLRAWLEECQTEHPRCRQTLDHKEILAARMIEIRQGQHQPIVRLASTEGLKSDMRPYVVLSHCWGGNIECSLTAANIEQYWETIDFDSLPKSFRDTISITSALQITYLWIDSLCIIQDDEQDWARESAKMAAIYRGATLAISMSSASSSDEGSSIWDPLPPATHFHVSNGDIKQDSSLFALRNVSGGPLEHELYQTLKNAPVHKRAWIFQEKILSRRILHATNSQFAWQCATHLETEDGLVRTQKAHDQYHPYEILATHVPEYVQLPVYNVRGRWWAWVAEYMGRSLTRAEDHYAAFAGVTRLYQDMTGDEPVVGLWKKDLLKHLAWYTEDPESDAAVEQHVLELLRLGDTRADEPSAALRQKRNPSWTWMTFPHGSVKPVNHRFDWIPVQGRLRTWSRYEAEVVDCDIQWSGTPLVSAPSSGVLKLRGWMDRMALPNLGGGRASDEVVLFDPDYLDDSYDLEEDPNRLFDVFVLFAYEQEGVLVDDVSTVNMVCLVLDREGLEQTYRRVGMVERYIRLVEGISVEGSLTGRFDEIKLV